MNYTLLVAGTIILILFSWFFSLKHKRYHAIPRFFVFESIFVLAMLNIRVWFDDPFSFLQIISWILHLIGYAIDGFLGKGNRVRQTEATTVLVKSNIYKYIRHPLSVSFPSQDRHYAEGSGLPQIVLGFIHLCLLCKNERRRCQPVSCLPRTI
jgi:protein-S-isoprenylcysteine O-methyltransferase Ste14